MNPRLRALSVVLFFGLLQLSAALRAAAEPAVPFRSLSFPAATAAAKAEGKLIFIDFFTTWCEPCKRLDADTWTDAAVGRLVGDRAVALKLDAEKEGRELAQRYRVDAYPTLLLLEADGRERDRIVGYRDPAKFRAEFAAGVAGRPALKRAEDAVAAAPSALSKEAVQARYDLGRTRVQNQQYEEALVEFLWCYDTGMPAVASFSGVRNSFLVSSIAQLGKKHPPALAALRERRDRAEAAMQASPRDRGAPMDFAALNDALGENARTLETFDGLPADDPRRSALLVRVYDLLVAAKRYDDAFRALPLERMEREFDLHLRSLERMAANAKSAGAPNPYPGYVTRATAKHIEVLLGAGQLEAARSLGGKLLAQVDHSDGTKNMLHEAAVRAGHPEIFPSSAN